MELKDIPGYEGVYAVDAEGAVYRTEKYGRRVRQRLALRRKRGYLVAHLCKDAIRKDVLAHRAVWQAFNGSIPDGLEINHKNGRRDDNRLANLETCTRSENAVHKYRVNGYRKPYSPALGTRNGSSKITADEVRRIRLLYSQGATQKELGEQFGISQVMAGKIVRRDNWDHVD